MIHSLCVSNRCTAMTASHTFAGRMVAAGSQRQQPQPPQRLPSTSWNAMSALAGGTAKKRTPRTPQPAERPASQPNHNQVHKAPDCRPAVEHLHVGTLKAWLAAICVPSRPALTVLLIVWSQHASGHLIQLPTMFGVSLQAALSAQALSPRC